MRTFHVRELMNLTVEEVLKLTGPMAVMYDTLEKIEYPTAPPIIFSWFYWQVLKAFPNVPVTPKHNILSIIKTLDGFNAGSNRKLMSQIEQDVVKHEKFTSPEQMEPLLALLMDANSMISYYLSRSISKFWLSLDIFDFTQIARHPAIYALKLEAYHDSSRIKSVYARMIETIKTHPDFKNNRLAKAVKAGMVSDNQVTQCIGFRGIVTEVDGGIFPQPVWSNYVMGLKKFSDFVTDSRTAAKSYFYSESPLQDSEYTSRQFHLYVTTLERVVWKDCGNTKLVPWQIRPKVVSVDGEVTYKGDLNFMIGKYYKTDPSGPTLTVTGKEEDLDGKTIFLRSILNCNMIHEHAICSHCVGELAYNVARFHNIGHLSTTTLTKMITQNILSIKHVNTSSTASKIFLDDLRRRYFNGARKQDAFYLNEAILKLDPVMVIERDQAFGLIELINNVSVDDINPSRVSEVSRVRFIMNIKGRKSDEMINVQQRGAAVLLSRELLTFIKERGVSVDTQNNFEIHLKGWNHKLPVLSLPPVEFSYVDLGRLVKTTLKSSQENIRNRQQHNSPVVLLQEIFDIVNAKLDVNIVCLEVAVAGQLVASPTSYALPKPGDPSTLSTVEMLIKNRSMGPAMAFETQHAVILNPASYYAGTRPDSLFDAFICPQEVVAAYPDDVKPVNRRQLGEIMQEKIAQNQNQVRGEVPKDTSIVEV